MCTAAHSRPCAALCPLVRLECLHHVPRYCICYLSRSSVQAQSCERVANSSRLVLQERSRCRRLKLWKTASSDCQSNSLFNPHGSFPIQRLCSTGSESQVPLRFSGQKPPVFFSNLIVSFAIGLCTRVTLCKIHPDKLSLATVGEGSSSDRDKRSLEVSAPPRTRESEIAFADSRSFPPRPASHFSEALVRSTLCLLAKARLTAAAVSPGLRPKPVSGGRR